MPRKGNIKIMRGNQCSLSTVVGFCFMVVLVWFASQSTKKSSLTKKIDEGNNQAEHEQPQVQPDEFLDSVCSNETLIALHAEVGSFLDRNVEEKRNALNEAEKMTIYSKFMQMCARERAISTCRRVSFYL